MKRNLDVIYHSPQTHFDWLHSCLLLLGVTLLHIIIIIIVNSASPNQTETRFWVIRSTKNNLTFPLFRIGRCIVLLLQLVLFIASIFECCLRILLLTISFIHRTVYLYHRIDTVSDFNILWMNELTPPGSSRLHCFEFKMHLIWVMIYEWWPIVPSIHYLASGEEDTQQ